MLGRPAICEPVFMNMWAGSWLIASVVIERIRQISSITEPMCGKSSLISVPFLPNLRKRELRAQADELLALELGELLAPGQTFGHRLAVHLGQLRLGVERLQVRWPAGHRQPDHPLGPLRQRRAAPRTPRAGCGTQQRRVEQRGNRNASRALGPPGPGRLGEELPGSGQFASSHDLVMVSWRFSSTRAT